MSGSRTSAEIRESEPWTDHVIDHTMRVDRAPIRRSAPRCHRLRDDIAQDSRILLKI